MTVEGFYLLKKENPPNKRGVLTFFNLYLSETTLTGTFATT
jgi:hypothetical protein